MKENLQNSYRMKAEKIEKIWRKMKISKKILKNDWKKNKWKQIKEVKRRKVSIKVRKKIKEKMKKRKKIRWRKSKEERLQNYVMNESKKKRMKGRDLMNRQL